MAEPIPITEAILQEVRDAYRNLFRHLDIAFEGPLEDSDGLPPLDTDDYEDNVEVAYSIGVLRGIASVVGKSTYQLTDLAVQGYEMLALTEPTASWEPIDFKDLFDELYGTLGDDEDDDDLETELVIIVGLRPGEEYTVERLCRVRRAAPPPATPTE